MWVLKKLKGSFKKENINTSGGGGGGSSSVKTTTITISLDSRMVEEAEDKVLRDRIFKEAYKHKDQKIRDFVASVDGYKKVEKLITELNIWR